MCENIRKNLYLCKSEATLNKFVRLFNKTYKIMTQERIDRINELSRKSKTPEGLTEEEKAEQQKLRRLYIDSFKESLVGQLECTYIVDEKGNKIRVSKKSGYEFK